MPAPPSRRSERGYSSGLGSPIGDPLARYEKLGAVDARPVDRLAHLALVSVHLRGVDAAVADLDRLRQRLDRGFRLTNNRLNFDQALSGIDASLEALNIDVLDLFLIHWPLPTVRDHVEPWKAFEKILAGGRVRSVGVSNFQIAHLQRILDECDIMPAVNQIEAHPYLTQTELVSFDDAHGIATEAWSPIGRGVVLDDEVLVRIGELHAKTAAQVTLIQRGSTIFPKSISPSRMRESFEIFDFELSGDEVRQIDALDRGERVGPDPDTFAMIPPG